MARVQAPNGLILNVPDAIAPGLVGSRNHSGWCYLPGDAATQPAPKTYASKPEWVAYAVARGVPQDEAESASKNDLIARLT